MASYRTENPEITKSGEKIGKKKENYIFLNFFLFFYYFSGFEGFF